MRDERARATKDGPTAGAVSESARHPESPSHKLRPTRGRGSRPPVGAPPGRGRGVPTNLPAELSSFVGRGTEQAEVRRLLGSHRLLTLTGVGGVGKTRLALRVAASVASRFAQGAWLVELAAIRDPGLVANAVAAALGVREQPGRGLQDTLIDVLREQERLLVVDNCEHLPGACGAVVQALLERCPHLTALATGRAPLGAPGEQVWTVPPLPTPDLADPPSAVPHRDETEAVQLFVERARSAHSRFRLTDANAAAVRQIAARLEGLPLAIELAAARVAVLTPEQIAARLDRRFALLVTNQPTAPARHQTLRASIQWSYDLLTEPEKRLFERVTVFAGGWTLDAAEAVGGGDGVEAEQVLELLTALVTSSRATVEQGRQAEARYTMLETLREFGHERLIARGEEAPVRDRHAGYYLALAEQGRPELIGPRARPWLDRLGAEDGNLRAAWRWAVDSGRADLQMRLAASTWEFRWMLGHLSEALDVVEAALRSGESPGVAHAIALHGAGVLLALHGQRAASAQRFAASAEEFRAIGDTHGLGRALADGGLLNVLLGDDPSEAERLLTEALAVGGQADDGFVVGYSLFGLAQAAFARGDGVSAAALGEDSIAIGRRMQSTRLVAHALYQLAAALELSGENARASRVGRECLALMVELGDTWGMLWALVGLAATAIAQPERAAHLLGIGESLRLNIGAVTMRPIEERWKAAGDAARSALGDERFERAWAAGQALSLDQAVAYALATDDTPASSSGGYTAGRALRHGPGELTRREREVLVPLGRGYTNRQIASELVIGLRTAETHVERILQKLGLENRAQAIVWLREHPDALPEHAT